MGNQKKGIAITPDVIHMILAETGEAVGNRAGVALAGVFSEDAIRQMVSVVERRGVKDWDKLAENIPFALSVFLLPILRDTRKTETIQGFSEGLIRKIGARKDSISKKNLRGEIRKAIAEDSSKLDALKEEKKDQGLKPSDKTVLQVVGELKPEEQKKFWVVVDRLQRKMNGGSQSAEPDVDQPGDEITRLINRVKLTKEQILAILAAKPDGLQEDLLAKALRQSTAAGGASAGLGRLWDRAVSVVETAMPSGTTSSGNLREKLAATNKRRKKEDDDVSGIR